MSGGALLLYMPMVVGPSMAIGLPYAVLAGLVYSLLPPRLQGPDVAFLVGTLSVLFWHGVYALFGANFGIAIAGVLSAVGGLSAFICARIVRWLGMDWQGAAERQRSD